MWNPLPNWQQQGSFVEPVAPPLVEADSAPQVCVSFSAAWLPYVLGAMMQLVQPSSWSAASTTDLDTTLQQATDLLGIIGQGGSCDMLRFTSDCKLQTSPDGTTWTDVTGWDTYANTCFAGFGSGPFSAPANPTGASTSQQACNIASYLAEDLIKAAINKAVSDITAVKTVFEFGLGIVALIPESGLLIDLFLGSAFLLYNAMEAGTLSDYSSAVADSTLWSQVTCAIYDAIKSVGYVNDTDYSAILTNLGAITYVHPGVITTIISYVTGLGANGLAQLQSTGALKVGDCSGCSTWCFEFNGASHEFQTPLWSYPGMTLYGILVGHPAVGVGAESDVVNANLGELLVQIALNPTPGVHLTFAEIQWTSSDSNPFGTNKFSHYGGTIALDNTAGSHTFIFAGDMATNEVGVDIAAGHTGSPGTVQLTYMKIKGYFADPFGGSTPIGATACIP